MYNPELKEEFLSQYTRRDISKINVVSAFNNMAASEHGYGKDLSEFTKDEIADTYLKMKIDSFRHLYNINQTNFRYTEWIRDNNKGSVAQNAYKQFASQDALEPMLVSKRELSEIWLLEMAKQFENPCNSFLLLAPFYGVLPDHGFRDLFEITKDSIDEKNNTIHLSRASITVPREVIKYALRSADTYEYHYEFDVRYRYLVGDGVFKFTKENPDKTACIQTIRNRYHSVIGPKIYTSLSFNGVHDAGIIYRCKLLMVKYGVSGVWGLWDNPEFLTEVRTRFGIDNKYDFKAMFLGSLKF